MITCYLTITCEAEIDQMLPDQCLAGIIQIPLPLLSVQKEIVVQIEAVQKMVNGNKKLIEIYEKKIKDKIGEVWGEKE